MTSTYPLRFHPVLKQALWGGRRLGDQLNKPLGLATDYAESWEIVDHGDDQSIVVDGPLAGSTLAEIVRQDPAWLFGQSARADSCHYDQFPLLLKYLDCNRVLSVQVHPDDAYAQAMPVPDLGKTECWYVVAADPDSKMYAGLQSGVTRKDLAQAVERGQVEDVLHHFHPEQGDCIFIPAGTVHALGAGLLVTEIQQSSNTTFRLFDWNRVDANGNPRDLHIEQSLEVTDYQSGPVHPLRTESGRTGWQPLVSCEKFELRALETGSGVIAGDDRFHILTVPHGTAKLQCGETLVTLVSGESILLPAAMPATEITVEQASTALTMTVPR